MPRPEDPVGEPLIRIDSHVAFVEKDNVLYQAFYVPFPTYDDAGRMLVSDKKSDVFLGAIPLAHAAIEPVKIAFHDYAYAAMRRLLEVSAARMTADIHRVLDEENER